MKSPKKESPVKRQRSLSRSLSPSESTSSPWSNSPRKKKSATGEEFTQRSQRNIPAFLNKLYSMVDDNSTNDLIRWSEDGKSFIVEQQEVFSKTVLPRFYKHNTFSSFVRQLNMYDFHKVPHIQQGVLVADIEHELWEFSHPNFQRNRYELLHLVVRKRIRSNGDPQQQQQQQQKLQHSSSSSTLPLQYPQQTHFLQHPLLLLDQGVAGGGLDGSTIARNRLDALGSTSTQLEHVRLGSLVKDISTIRDHQHAISSDLQHLHNDNEILWRETLMAREKHQRHQQVIERILLFLTTVFTNDAANIAKHPHTNIMGKQDEFLTGGSQPIGSSNSVACPPGKLIEEAVKLAGISTTSLHEKFINQHSEFDKQTNALSSSLSQQQASTTQQQQPFQQPVHQQSTENNQNQSQDKGKEGMPGGVRGMEPSSLFRALHDLYSIRDTFSTSHPPGMNSSAMEPSFFSRSGPLSSSTFSSTAPSTEYHHGGQNSLQQHQQSMGPSGTTGNDSNGSTPMNHVNDNILGIGSTATGSGGMNTSSVVTSPLGTSVASTTTSSHTFGAFSPFNELSSIGESQSSIGDGDITRITGLAQSLHTATRSAEAISQDIDDLQISIESLAATMGLDANGIEGFDGYMDEFTDNYSNMISMATRNDKIDLFNLAADSNNQHKDNDQQQHQPQQEKQHQQERNSSASMNPNFQATPPSSS
ncbi:hypothetical protein BCR42DRAFT_447441 [Absidia repens]|uniref:HSF-type DNA-binding domain-containing protein n=1 Tax=Absidia repens TaxID=90262 RepID=A0A1X2ITL3_9FUNG|nr:hypothetical protein BCR42DRAFT_447441 [Absidia repens]